MKKNSGEKQTIFIIYPIVPTPHWIQHSNPILGRTNGAQMNFLETKI
jgi:hypothetical protein